jgi:hypothetical protein
MRPDMPCLVDGALATLAEIVATSDDPQEASKIQGVMQLLAVMRKEWDSAAAWRAAAIGDLTTALQRGAELVEPQLRASLEASLKSVEDGGSHLRISALDGRLDLLRQAAIDLETSLEASDDPGAAEVLDALWRLHGEDAKARTFVEYLW